MNSKYSYYNSKNYYLNFVILLTLLFSIVYKCNAQQVCNEASQFGWFVPVRFARSFVAYVDSTLTMVEDVFGRSNYEVTLT